MKTKLVTNFTTITKDVVSVTTEGSVAIWTMNGKQTLYVVREYLTNREYHLYIRNLAQRFKSKIDYETSTYVS